MNPAAHNNKAIRWAAHNGHVDAVRCLCELQTDRGVNPGAEDNYAIQWAVAYGHLNVVRYSIYVICLVTEPWIQLLISTPCNGQLPMWCDTCAMYCYLSQRGFQPRPQTAATVFVAAVSDWGYWSGLYQHLLARMNARASVLVLHALVRACRGGITRD